MTDEQIVHAIMQKLTVINFLAGEASPDRIVKAVGEVEALVKMLKRSPETHPDCRSTSESNQLHK